MNISNKIRELSRVGKTVSEIQKEMPDVSLSYIYKVRSISGKKEPALLTTALQRDIKRLSRRNTPAEISKLLGCSEQYVYKTLKSHNFIETFFIIKILQK